MFADVNGVKLFFKKSGNKSPILLLHGNTQSHRVFNVVTKELQNDYAVYALDSRDHGKSTKVKDLHYTDMTDDVIEFIEKIIKEPVIIYGLSDGGILALMTAMRRPDLLKKIIVSGASTRPEDTVKYSIALFKFALPIMPGKMRMLLTEPDISAKDLSTIKTPTVVLAGSKDMIKREATLRIAANIPGSRLEILEGEGHTSYAVNSKKLYPILRKYLNTEE